MAKKIIAIVLAVVIVIGAAVGIGVHIAGNSVEPKIKSENLAANINFEKEEMKSLTDKSKSSAYTFNKGDVVEMDFGKQVTFNSIVLREKGDNVNQILFYLYDGKKWKKFYELDRIMDYRLGSFEAVTTQKIKIEVVDCKAPVEITDMKIYSLPKSANKDFRTVQLLSMGAKNDIVKYSIMGEKSFNGYYGGVTDVVLTGEISVDQNGTIVYVNGEDMFTANLEALKTIIGDRKVKIWLGFNPDLTNGNDVISLDDAKAIIKKNKKAIAENLKALVEKHGVYGVTFDWDYPENGSQWSAYSKLIKKTAKNIPVSASLGSDGGDLSSGAIKKLEFVNAEAFDIADERGDYANYESVLKAAKTFKKAGFEKEQIVIGIPTFGKAGDGTTSDVMAFKGNEKELAKYNKVLKDVEYTDKDGKTVKGNIYVESFGEARDKTKLAQECGLGGVAICSANTDAVSIYRYAIHNAVYEAVNSGIGTASK